MKLFRKLVLVLTAAFSAAACVQEESIELEGGSLPMILQGGVVPFDADTKAEYLSFSVGDVIYVRLENGPSVVLGTATFNNGEWTFTYNGSLLGWETVDAKCYYLPGSGSQNNYKLALSPDQAVYEDLSAYVSIGASSLTLSTWLTPKTGRLTMGKDLGDGSSRNVRILSGLSYLNSFSLTDYSFTSASAEMDFAFTPYNYFHGFFTDPEDATLRIQSGSLIYSRAFDSGTVLQAGHSGYLTVPNYSSHDGWTIENPIEMEVEEFSANGVSFMMVSIPAGTFKMGTERYSDFEQPVHNVTLNAYKIGQTEVTQALWEAVMGSNPSSHQGDGTLPVEMINYWDAQVFLFKLSRLTGRHFRLPTEAEWEYAARELGGDFIYSGSDILADFAWYNGNSDGTNPVGTRGANALGLSDMSGNVWEMVSDWKGDYPLEDQTNPLGNSFGSTPILRGGSYMDNDSCRSTFRNYDWDGNYRFVNAGLRLACDGPVFEPEKVDLGLPSGVLWSSFNIGARRPSDIGLYIAWGEKEPGARFYWSDYDFSSGDNDQCVSKYTFDDGERSGIWYTGDNVFIGDGIKILDPSDDTATALWGDQWRMPSEADIEELLRYCSWEEDLQNGISGKRITGPSGNSIFLPYTGCIVEDGFDGVNSYGWYPATSVGNISRFFTSLTVNGYGEYYLERGRTRMEGYPVRPVWGAGTGGNYGMEVSGTLSFGNSPVNVTTLKTLSVSNTGYLPLTVTVSSDNEAFIPDDSSFILPAQQTLEVSVAFSPVTVGDYSGDVTVSAAEISSTFVLPVSGRGFDISATTYSYGGVSFNMVNVPGGTFDMGMDGSRWVTVSDFSIGQTEVTQGLWEAVMGNNPSAFQKGDSYPVEKVSWYEAKAFCARLSALTGYDFRLPTEAEWELAARGGYPASSEAYSGSDDVDEVACYEGNCGASPFPVMTKYPNQLGLYDMSGNVWEWCEGFYGDRPDDGSVDPRGWAYGYDSANHRGGAFDSPAEDCTVTMRSHFLSGTNRWQAVGFRLAMGGPVYAPEAVDLGLSNGVKWASFNIGACAPEEAGDFLAWGETIPKYDYSWNTYAWWNESGNLSKYDGTDGLVTLQAEDDAACVRWGRPWRMPSEEDFNILSIECSWNRETVNGMDCLRATGPNGNSILIPLPGLKCDSDWYYSPGNDLSVYALSKVGLSDYDNCYAIYADYQNVSCSISFFSRCFGFQVRPVQGGIIHVESVSLNRPGLTLHIGESAQLTATLSPGTATDQSVTWSSSDRSVVTVDQTGKVTASGAGTATITVTTQDRNLTATCKVTVLYGNNGNPSGGGSEGIGGGEDD